MQQAMSFFGLFGMVGLAWLMSEGKRQVPWRVVIWGMLLQLGFGLVVLSPQAQVLFFTYVDSGVRTLIGFSERGADFAFQTVDPHYVTGPDGAQKFYAGHISPPLKTFAFWILPSIIFFSSLMAVSYHLGLMQKIVHGMAWLMFRTMGTSGAETLSTAANVFLGQTEAPLLVKPFLARMTRSELFCVMLGGFANTAGGVLAAYVGFLHDVPGIAGHLVTSSILSAPATLVIAKVMIPEREVPETANSMGLNDERPDGNVMAAAARGASEGMQLAINVAAMLIAFVALMAMADWALGLIPVMGAPLSLSRALGWCFTPLAFLMGIPWDEAGAVGRLLGEKLVLTEFIAYVHLGALQASANPLSERSAVIASYALCGFANFASVGIQLGGIGPLAPHRSNELAALSFRAMLGGSLATFMTACVAGMMTAPA
jgi:concentrative nucleoside transporter, CNT family